MPVQNIQETMCWIPIFCCIVEQRRARWNSRPYLAIRKATKRNVLGVQELNIQNGCWGHVCECVSPFHTCCVAASISVDFGDREVNAPSWNLKGRRLASSHEAWTPVFYYYRYCEAGSYQWAFLVGLIDKTAEECCSLVELDATHDEEIGWEEKNLSRFFSREEGNKNV